MKDINGFSKTFKFFALALLPICMCYAQKGQNAENGITFKNKHTIQVVDSIYKKMTVNDRVAQLYGIRPNELLGPDGRLSLDSCRVKIPNGIGHLCQFACSMNYNPNDLRDFVKDLQHYLKTETHAGIPAIFHEEAISGFAAKNATVYPQQIGVASTWNPALASLKTEQTAEAMRMIGATLALSPMADVIRTPFFNRIEESYGEDGFLNARMTLAFVNGLQKRGLSKGVAACTKHFLGYGGGIESTHKEIMEEILLPHEVAIKKGYSKVIMSGYHSYLGKKVVASDTLLQGILRKYLKYDGLIVSDYGAVTYNSKQNPDTLKSRAAEAINAGNDLELSDGRSYPYLSELLREKKVSEQRFEDAVKRNLTLKVRLGLFDNNGKFNDDGNIILDRKNYRQTAYDLACQSIVLLKNNGILPLNESRKKVALVGPNANTFWCMVGDYSYQSMNAFWFNGKIDGKSPEIIPLYKALKDRLSKGNIQLNYERGCDWNANNESAIDKSSEIDPRLKRLKMMLMESSDPTDWNKAIKLGSHSDVIIAAVGENPTLCGEGRSRKGIRLPGDQERFVEELVATGKPVILVVFGGRPQVLGDLTEKCSAILEAWYPGEEGGNAVADILTGAVNPSAKLTVSYPATEAEENYCYNYGKSDMGRIAYPFGYGLSFTSFKYSNLQMQSKANTKNKTIPVSFELENSGKRDGDEIVQLYISPLSGQNMKPIQLKGFQRVPLKSGEKRQIIFKLPLDLFAIYDNNAWNILPGKYKCSIGSSSADIRLSSSFLIEGAKVMKPMRSEYFPIVTIK